MESYSGLASGIDIKTGKRVSSGAVVEQSRVCCVCISDEVISSDFPVMWNDQGVIKRKENTQIKNYTSPRTTPTL